MTDYLGMKQRFWKAIWESSEDAIDKVLQEAWQDGYNHGVQDGWDKATHAEEREREILEES